MISAWGGEMGIDRDILEAALDAACESTSDAATHTETPAERDLLNEQWAQSYIGLALNDMFRQRYSNDKAGYVSFETTVSWLDGYLPAPTKPGPRPGGLTARQRFDAVLWSKGGKATGLVELKDRPFMGRYAESSDPQKLCGGLRRWPTLRWAMFLFSIRCPAKSKCIDDDLAAKRDDILMRIRKDVGDFWRVSSSKIVPGRGSRTMWVGVVFRRPGEAD
ncbi:hypothetical protein [Allosphingosinicella deserti]|uniref:Uncharacterized protein n=1 Tax=Allosphingosinicella deserti TaxID=2116704 RepID=A0A2P7QRL5_9SPHN|nr:hypothetical protein [Sphingomonas deserti]PSJ40594.1 hypothetical protein C7I55_09720 [Sphingomonas deserti]